MGCRLPHAKGQFWGKGHASSLVAPCGTNALVRRWHCGGINARAGGVHSLLQGMTADANQPSVCSRDAAFCQITLTTYYYYMNRFTSCFHCLCKWSSEVNATVVSSDASVDCVRDVLCCLSLLSRVSYLSVCLSLPWVHQLLCYYDCKAKMYSWLSFICSLYEQDESKTSEHSFLHFIQLLCDTLLCSRSKRLCIACFYCHCIFIVAFSLFYFLI